MAPGLWLKNIFVPMYGQRDFQGRVASFFIRFVNVIVRSVSLLMWFAVCVIFFATWIAIPLFVGYMFIISLTGA